MKRNIIFLSALFVLLAMVSCNSSDDSIVLIRENGSISGTVIDVASGDPVPGAKIVITSRPFINDATGTGDIDIVTTTDFEGRFNRGDVPVGTVRVKVSRDGYITPDPQFWALSPGGFGTFTFELAPGDDPIEKFEDKDDRNAWPPNYQPGK